MEQIYAGKVCWVFPDNFDTDQIIGSQYMNEFNYAKLSAIAMKQFTDNFSSTVERGDILVCGSNFGYGHPHGQGMGVMRYLGIDIILGESFSHNFQRSELADNGIAILTIPDISKKVQLGDRLHVDYVKGLVKNLSTGKVIQGIVPSQVEIELVQCNGLKNYLKCKAAKENDYGGL